MSFMIRRKIQNLLERTAAPIVLIMALSIGGSLWWQLQSKIPSTKTPPSVNSIIVRASLENLDYDLEQQLALARDDVQKKRIDVNCTSLAVGTALLRLACLELAVGTCEASASALQDVIAIHAANDDWQVRQATRQLDDLRTMAARSDSDKEHLRDTCRKLCQAELLHANGRFLEGIAIAEDALNQQRELWGDTQANLVDSLLRLAWLCTEHADHYLRAKDIAKQAAEATRTTYGELHPAYGDCQYLQAPLADDRGDFDEADRFYEDALAIYKDSVGEMSRQYARTLCHQGRMYDTWWKEFASAKLIRADFIRQQVLQPQDPDRAESLEFLARAQYALRQFPRAEALLNQALEIRIAHQGAGHPDVANSKSLLGVCLGMHGDSSKASLFVYDALDLTEKARGAKHPATAVQRCLLGKVKHFGIGDYAGAYREYEVALGNWRQLGLQNHPHYCGAIVCEVEALSQMMAQCRDTAAPKSDRSWQLVYKMMNRAEDAVSAYHSLPHGDRMGIYAAVKLWNTHYLTNFSRLNLADAEKTLSQIERTVMENGGELHPNYLQLLSIQGLFLRCQGKHVEAVEKDEEIVRRYAQTWGNNDPWQYTSSCLNLSESLLNDGRRLDRARDLVEEAFATVLNLFRKDGPGQNGSGRLSMLRDCHDALSFLLSVAAVQQDLAATYDHVLAVKGSVSAFQLADRLANDHPELVEVQALREKAQTARQELKAIAFSGSAETVEWVDQLTHASDAREIAENRLALEMRPIIPAEKVVTWKEMRHVLPPRTAFIDFLQYTRHSAPTAHRGYMLREPHMLAFVTTDSGSPVCVELGLSRPIRFAVSAWRRALQQYQREGFDNIEHATQILADLVWAPLQQHLKDVDTLAIAPDGPLSFVSFAAMPGRNAGSYAVEDYTIHYTNSGRWLYEQLQNDRNRPSGTGLLVCGDIQYQTENRDPSKKPLPSKMRQSTQSSSVLLPDVEEINNLKASGPEIEAVQGLFTKNFGDQVTSVTLSKAVATEMRMRASLERNWKCIHFAGHGLFIPPENAGVLTGQGSIITENHVPGPSNYFVERNQLLLSGLVFAAASPQEKRPGFLTAEDLGSFDLRQTDLVVLSACDTGLGCTAGGDGVLGLTRAFLTAGARSVVSSLWKVDDAATSLLMQEFYKNLWERGLPKSEALRQAQLSLLRDASSIHTQRNDLIAQLKRSLPDLSEEELTQSSRGLVPGYTEDIDETSGSKQLAEASGTLLRISRTHPALWAAFILNGESD